TKMTTTGNPPIRSVGRRSRHRTRDRQGVEVGAQEIKLVLGKLKTPSQRHVRGLDREKGPSIFLHQVAKSFPMEQLPFVDLGGQITPVEMGRGQTNPVPRRAKAPEHLP